jgi:hypothetical protein
MEKRGPGMERGEHHERICQYLVDFFDRARKRAIS